ncbi:hypothetical protein [Paenibacillus thermotolerans]|uniref:hypothetical protein n=1 Tax=Paenibacillus thermotolerans TaxID=3027807 RepID=UPI002368D1E7|nr:MULTISPECIES: hypothetical protein [unclassified Paenibacillus]
MKTTALRPFVPSGKDYALAQRFFVDLGFDKVYSDDELSLFRMGEQEFYLQNFHNQEFQENFMVELVVEELDTWWSHIKTAILEKDYPVKAKEPTDYPWGKREIHVIDPAGVCWHISEAKK